MHFLLIPEADFLHCLDFAQMECLSLDHPPPPISSPATLGPPRYYHQTRGRKTGQELPPLSLHRVKTVHQKRLILYFQSSYKPNWIDHFNGTVSSIQAASQLNLTISLTDLRPPPAPPQQTDQISERREFTGCFHIMYTRP